MPLFLLPAIAAIYIYQVPKAYRTHSTITIDQTIFDHPLLEEYRSNIDLERRFATIKQQVIGNKSLHRILNIESANGRPLGNPAILEETRERIKVKLSSSGLVSISYSGNNPQEVKKVVDNSVEAFLLFTFEPFRGIKQRLTHSLEKRDRILSSIIIPKLTQAEFKYENAKHNFTEQAFEYVSAKYEYEHWLEKLRDRQRTIEAQVGELIPLKQGKLDTSRIARTLVPAEIPKNPFEPQQGRILLFSFVGGAILGVLLVCLRRFLDDSIRRPSDIEEMLGVPVIGRVPKLWEAEYADTTEQTLSDFETAAVQTQESRSFIVDSPAYLMNPPEYLTRSLAYLTHFHETAEKHIPTHDSHIVELKAIETNDLEKRPSRFTLDPHESHPVESSRAPPIRDVAA
ncbi:MAG: hypothetical protein GY866_42240 [Proteobacteria bacterium]|nr:hypothetical protein [Pseudomonadota bacterium]